MLVGVIRTGIHHGVGVKGAGARRDDLKASHGAFQGQDDEAMDKKRIHDTVSAHNL